MKVELCHETIERDDMDALSDWIKTYPRLTKGPLTLELEKQWSNLLEISHTTFVNSGSSAILLALNALLINNRLKNKLVVVPSLCWATNVAPLIQMGLEPIFCDSNKNDLNIDIDSLENIFKCYQPAAILLVHVLGFINDMDRILELCKKYNVELIEDCCETMGSTYNLKQAGTFGAISCFSLYFSHTISCIEGGFISTNDKDLDNTIKMLRNHGWSRDLDSTTQEELRTKYNIDKFKEVFTFYIPGFNVRSTDLQAFIALRQLEKLPSFVKKREDNFFNIRSKIDDSFWKPQPIQYNDYDIVSNFAYPLIHPRWREITSDLIKSGVETRPLIAGAISLQPFVKEYANSISYATWVEKVVDKEGFYIPNHPYLTEEEIDYMTSIINKYKN
jgi:CDP-6-deoxy-D-xylo-4-hexulose-3-dehydrase